jgi:pyruvate formate lyase activating enzyme
MDKKPTGIVYDIQGFALHDGPGIRTTVFLKGCPLRCPWCHSPESQQFHPQLSWLSAKCVGIGRCGKCLDACPKHGISPGKIVEHAATRENIQHIHINRSLCDNCGNCAAACVYKSLFVCGTEYTVEDLIQRLSKDLPFYVQSGGGVTVSGGEPLSQPHFVLPLLKGLKAYSINTALDTTGHAPFKIIESVMPYTDLFLYDLKHMDPEQHRIVTGVSNDLIMENARKIAAAGAKMQIRIPVIPNFNDSEKNIHETGAFCRKLGEAVTVIQLLPYHNLGVMKYQRLDDSKTVLEAVLPTDEKISSIKAVLESFGLPVTVH